MLTTTFVDYLMRFNDSAKILIPQVSHLNLKTTNQKYAWLQLWRLQLNKYSKREAKFVLC